MLSTSIEWTEKTWNPVSGCTRVSAGCDHCYAATLTRRLAAMGQSKYAGLVNEGKGHFNGVIKCHDAALNLPLHWRKPRVIFVNSMSDLFHPGVPDVFIQRVFNVMVQASQHTFQILTKRPERVAELSAALPWPANVWMGTSVEDERVVDRIHHLQHTDAAVKFLSCEPLIGPIPDISLAGVDWVITGGESGARARPMDVQWVRTIRDHCLQHGAAHFFKQFGKIANNPDGSDPTAKQNGGTAKGGRMLDGRTWDEMPAKGSAAV